MKRCKATRNLSTQLLILFSSFVFFSSSSPYLFRHLGKIENGKNQQVKKKKNAYV